MLRERLYAIAAGYSRQDDADLVAHDPAFKIAVWDKAGTQVADERIASQPTASRLVALLSQWHNKEALRQHLATPILRHQRQGGDDRKVALGVVDVDGFPVETHGEQPGAEYNGYYKKTVYSPLAACFTPNGTFEARRLGGGFLHGAPGRAHSLGGGSPLRTLMTGTASRTARVSTARWNPKEAVRKVPAR